MNIIPIVYNGKNENGSDIYSKLLENRIIFVSGEINEFLSNNIIAELLYLDSLSHDDIYLYINSPGGDVNHGLAIYDTINFVKSDVCTVGFGLVASMGAFLLSSGNFGKRFVLKNTEIMIHQIFGSFEGKYSSIKISTERVIELQKRINKILAKNTNKSLRKIEHDIENDFYLSAIEAKSYGIIDEIL